MGGIAYTDKEIPQNRRGIRMKIDKKMLESLLNLPDDKLMQMIRMLTGNMGSSSKPPSPETVAGLRNVIKQVTDEDISRATELIEMYKQGKKG